MKNRNIILLILIVILGSALAYLYYEQKSNEITSEEFNISNIEDIGSVEITDKYNNHTLLSKKDKVWYVNDTIPADKQKILMLMTVLNKLNVEYPVSDQLRDKVIEDLRRNAIKVKISDEDNDEIKTIHLANDFNGKGNNMILSHDGVVSSQPYIVKVLGTKKNVKHMFQAEPNMWYTTGVFETKVDHIKEIDVTYFDKPENSFKLTKNEDLIKITPTIDSLAINKGLDKFKVVNFLLEFEDMHFENRVGIDSFIDTIKQAKPFMNIVCINVWDEKEEITLYYKRAEKEKKNRTLTGEYTPHEIDRYWAYIPSLKQYATAQHYVFGPVMMDYSYFFEK